MNKRNWLLLGALQCFLFVTLFCIYLSFQKTTQEIQVLQRASETLQVLSTTEYEEYVEEKVSALAEQESLEKNKNTLENNLQNIEEEISQLETKKREWEKKVAEQEK